MLITRPMYLIHPDGIEQPLCISIDGPRPATVGPSHLSQWRSFCRVTFGIPDEHPQEVYGLDDLHTLAQALACVSDFLRVLATQGQLVFADGTPYDEQIYDPLLLVAEMAESLNVRQGKSN